METEQSDDVRFLVVWVNRGLDGDRDAVDPTLLDERRVAQYWDAQGATGTFFADADLGGLGQKGFVYDAYYVFGPDATWAEEPGPVTGAGLSVASSVDQLLAELRAQL